MMQVTFWCEKTAVRPVQIVTNPPKNNPKTKQTEAVLILEACGMRWEGVGGWVKMQPNMKMLENDWTQFHVVDVCRLSCSALSITAPSASQHIR